MTVGLRYCSDMSAAEWLVRSSTPAMQLIGFGPATFEAYARLRFIPDPSGPGQDEANAHVAMDHPSDIAAGAACATPAGAVHHNFPGVLLLSVGGVVLGRSFAAGGAKRAAC